MITEQEFRKLLEQPEDHNLEFKTAQYSFSKDKDLPDYCAAMANENGGKLILGVSPDGKVIGTKAFQGTYNKMAHELLNKM